MSAWDPWSYREQVGPFASGMTLVGYEVEATDGGIGKVTDATYDVGSSYVVVDTGPWIFGRKVTLPAGTIERVDAAAQKVYVDRTKNEIKDSPPFDTATDTDAGYRDQLGGYYGGGL